MVLSVLVIIALAAFFIWKIQNKKQTNTAPSLSPQTAEKSDRINDEAFKNALNAYVKAKQEGTDLSDGPCLGIIAPDWVLDIAHNPRQPVDDKEENQCPQYRSGQAKHFIELDPEGKLIRAK